MSLEGLVNQNTSKVVGSPPTKISQLKYTCFLSFEITLLKKSKEFGSAFSILLGQRNTWVASLEYQLHNTLKVEGFAHKIISQFKYTNHLSFEYM
jgi:hypothetical protein